MLIVGYGNTLRGDDGLGPRVAEAIEGMGLPNVRTLACTQLTPELAETMSQTELVIFVDAAVDPPRRVQVRRLVPKASGQFTGHASDPAALLALARDLYGHAPLARLVRIPAANLELGEELSELGQRGFNLAVEAIRRLVNAPQ